jgi:hypothetical protein
MMEKSSRVVLLKSAKVALNSTSSKAHIAALMKRFEEIHYYRFNKFRSFLSEPHQVLNADETDFLLNPRSAEVLVATADKHVYQQENND